MSEFNPKERQELLNLAKQSIGEGLRSQHPLTVSSSDYSETLNRKGASFVTLQLNGQLRGCIGSLQAYRTLIEDVSENAFSAAFRDPRFPPVSKEEAEQLEIHISVLSDTSPIYFESEADLLAQIRPNIDGLVLEDGFYRGTFLPSVWEQLPDKEAFLSHLKQKAGLPPNHWSPTLKVERYTVESIE